uniref:Uncharacterized protein n=1 Tax=Arundo donax TaxID=35708 RepID=A0A0A9CC62_ARUDO
MGHARKEEACWLYLVCGLPCSVHGGWSSIGLHLN